MNKWLGENLHRLWVYWMQQHYPKGTRYSALEKNILKYRAFEMVLILFRLEQLRTFVLESISATHRMGLSSGSRNLKLPTGTKQRLKKAWKLLVEDRILTSKEGVEIQELIDYRNVIAHATEQLTVDLNRDWIRSTYLVPELRRYEPTALARLEALAEKIYSGMGPRYILHLSLDRAMFEPAERAYKEELGRLSAKIQKQIGTLNEEIADVNANIASLPSGMVEELEPYHPLNITRSGTLSSRGIECCYALFRAGATPLATAYLMRISLRSAKMWYARWDARGRDGDCKASASD